MNTARLAGLSWNTAPPTPVTDYAEADRGSLAAVCATLLETSLRYLALAPATTRRGTLKDLCGLTPDRLVELYLLHRIDPRAAFGSLRSLAHLKKLGYFDKIAPCFLAKKTYAPVLQNLASTSLADVLYLPPEPMHREQSFNMIRDSLALWQYFFGRKASPNYRLLCKPALNDGLIKCLGDWSAHIDIINGIHQFGAYLRWIQAL